MATKTIDKELVEMENKYWQAMQDKDVQAAIRMTEFPCLIAGASGVSSVEQAMYEKIMSGAQYTLHSFSITAPQVRLLGEDVAVLVYKVTEDLTVDGKPVKLEAADSSVWHRKDGAWLCAMHTESVQGDAYGRDRNKG